MRIGDINISYLLLSSSHYFVMSMLLYYHCEMLGVEYRFVKASLVWWCIGKGCRGNGERIREVDEVKNLYNLLLQS